MKHVHWGSVTCLSVIDSTLCSQAPEAVRQTFRLSVWAPHDDIHLQWLFIASWLMILSIPAVKMSGDAFLLKVKLVFLNIQHF